MNFLELTRPHKGQISHLTETVWKIGKTLQCILVAFHGSVHCAWITTYLAKKLVRYDKCVKVYFLYDKSIKLKQEPAALCYIVSPGDSINLDPQSLEIRPFVPRNVTLNPSWMDPLYFWDMFPRF